MLDKFIQSNEVCFNVGYPTALGWLIIVGLLFLIIISRIWEKER
jgi:hypothetical protein